MYQKCSDVGTIHYRRRVAVVSDYLRLGEEWWEGGLIYGWAECRGGGGGGGQHPGTQILLT